MPTSELLALASTVAARLERRGEQCSPQDAIDRAESAVLQVQQLEALRDLESWADTVPCPESLAA